MNIKQYSESIEKKSEIFAEVISACGTLLKHHEIAKEAKDYLKLRIPKTIKGFSFGYFPSNENLKILFEIIDQKKLEEVGLVYNKYIMDGGFNQKTAFGILSDHNLIMPYKNLYGDIIGVVGRTLLENYKELNISKYKNSALRKGLSLFGLYNAKKEIISKDAVIIVEGQFDCITCHRFGIKNVVALGGSAFTKFHLFLLLRYTNNIYLLLDSDSAGVKATDRIYKINELYGLPAKINKIELPEGFKDIDEFLINDIGAVKYIEERLCI